MTLKHDNKVFIVKPYENHQNLNWFGPHALFCVYPIIVLSTRQFHIITFLSNSINPTFAESVHLQKDKWTLDVLSLSFMSKVISTYKS